MAVEDTIEHEPAVRERRPPPVSPLVALVVLLVLVGVFVALHRHRSSHPVVADAHARLSDLQAVSAADEPASNVRAALVSLAGTDHIGSVVAAMSPNQEYVLGRVHVAGVDAPRYSEYVLAVIDRRTNQVARTMYSTDPEQGSGWDGTMNEVAHRYPWLSSFRDGPGGIVNQTALEWRAGKPRDLTFYAVLDRDQPPVTSLSDVRVVLVLMGPDGQVWGAERLR